MGIGEPLRQGFSPRATLHLSYQFAIYDKIREVNFKIARKTKEVERQGPEASK